MPHHVRTLNVMWAFLLCLHAHSFDIKTIQNYKNQLTKVTVEYIWARSVACTVSEEYQLSTLVNMGTRVTC